MKWRSQLFDSRKYEPPRDWSKVGAWGARSADGSEVWLDFRGLVGLRRPDGAYFALGASLADTGDEPHDADYGPPPAGSRLKVFAQTSLVWYRGDINTKHAVPPTCRDAFLQSLSLGLAVIGYVTEVVDVP